MKKSEVEIGGVYVVRVSRNLVHVQIESESPHGGWDGRNLKTMRLIHLKSARRLQRRILHSKNF